MNEPKPRNKLLEDYDNLLVHTIRLGKALGLSSLEVSCEFGIALLRIASEGKKQAGGQGVIER